MLFYIFRIMIPRHGHHVLNLKMEPTWLNVFESKCEFEEASHLLSDGPDPITIPTLNLLAASSLVRSMVGHLHPDVASFVLYFPGVSCEALLCARQILTKGVAKVDGKSLVKEVKEFFQMICVDSSFSISEVDGGLENEEDADETVFCEYIEKEYWKENNYFTTMFQNANSKEMNIVTGKLDNLDDDRIDNTKVNFCEDNFEIMSNADLDGKKVVTGNEIDETKIWALQHSPELPKCPFCDYKYRSEKNLSKHMIKHNGEKFFTCDQCDFKTAYSRSLETHKMRHSGEKPFKCDQCNFRTRHSMALMRHKRTHSGERPFRPENYLRKVIGDETHANENFALKASKLLKCSFCDYKCRYESQFAKHVRKHTGEKPLKCDQCDFKTNHSKNLVNHRMGHTGEKPFKCDKCTFQTRHRRSLAEHKRGHNGEKPYKCDVCEYATAFVGSLRNHKKMVHLGCNICEFKTVHSRKLERHKKKHDARDI